MINKILAAARAQNIPAGWAGLWFIRKARTTEDQHVTRKSGQVEFLPAGLYTHLFRLTTATMNKNPPGESVMEDTPTELHRHLEFMLKARGQVLVTGLGLGCVARGLLANPNVEHVTIIENSPDVIKLVWPHMNYERMTLVEADALEWTKTNKQKFNCAWHDLWTDREAGEPWLDVWHAQLMFNCIETVERQGAWNMCRVGKRIIQQKIRMIG